MATALAHARAGRGLKRGRRRATAHEPLAIALLKKDHRDVEKMLERFERLDDDGEKRELFRKIATALKVHTQIEEEIFYAEERGDVEDDKLDEAQVEHDSAKHMIADIEQMEPGDELYDAKVKVLGEYVKHHVKEEERPGGIFSQARKGDEDLDAMGKRLQRRKRELMMQHEGH